MKFTKRISLLIALAVCVTIGGVYATWNYSSQNAVNDEPINLSVSLTNYNAGENAKGSLQLLEEGVDIFIDDTDNNYIAELVMSGRLVVLFVPYSQAEEAKQDGIDVQFTLSSTLKYGTEDIFSIGTTASEVIMTKITTENATTVVSGQDLTQYIADDAFVGVVEASQLDAKIDINTFELDSLDLYHEFQDALASVTITITFSEKTA